MEMIKTEWDSGRVAFQIPDFGTQVIVEPISEESAYIEVWDEAGLAERSERPRAQAVNIARTHLFLVFRDEHTELDDE